MTDRHDEHPWATPEGQRRAEVIDSVPAAPVAPVESPRTYLCHGCGKYFPATAYAKHLPECGQEVQAGPVPWDEHDEAEVRSTGTYEDRKAKENFRRFGDPTGPKGGK